MHIQVLNYILYKIIYSIDLRSSRLSTEDAFKMCSTYATCVGTYFAEIADYYRRCFVESVITGGIFWLLPGDFYVIYGGRNVLECHKSMYIITGDHIYFLNTLTLIL